MFVSMLVVRALVAELASMGIDDLPHLLRSSSIPPPETSDPCYGVPLQDYAQLVRGAIHASGDPSLGLRLGARTPARALQVLSHLLLATSSLREAHASLSAYASALSGVLHFALKERDDVGYFVFSVTCPHDDVTRFAAEYALALALNVARDLSAQQALLSEAWFSHAAPPYGARYSEVFGAPVRFGQPMNALVFARKILDVPLRYAADPTLGAILRGAADQLLIEPARDQTYSQRVRQALRYELDLSRVDFDRLAGRWGVTRRTLRRRLRAEGSVLSELLDEARYRAATKQLTDQDESIKEIAKRLGYAETSSFHRAFRRWAGVAPSEFRRRARLSAE